MNRDIIQYEIDIEHIVISITDDKDFPLIPIKKCLDILKLSIWDYDNYGHNEFSIPEEKIYKPEHAKQVLEFVFKYLDKVNLIICQCDAGISRSSATAAALSKIMKDYDQFYFNHYCPNSLIYKTILDEYVENKDYYRTKFNLQFPDYFE